jgi:hypothetical protein
VALVQYLERIVHAGTAAGGYAEFLLQTPQVADTAGGDVPNLLFSDRIANANVHRPNRVKSDALLERK